jgi:hypothetical protein
MEFLKETRMELFDEVGDELTEDFLYDQLKRVIFLPYLDHNSILNSSNQASPVNLPLSDLC